MKSPIIQAYVTATRYGEFTTFGYDLNEKLRRDCLDNLSVCTRQVVAEFDALFTASSNSSLILYRATSMDTLTPFISNGQIQYPAFMSTSRSLDAAIIFLGRINRGEEKVLLKIIYPKAKPYIDAQGINNEQEVLLPRNCTFSISDWLPDESEQLRIDLLISEPLKLKLMA